eukprot:4338850-Amphidinium_carterae.1
MHCPCVKCFRVAAQSVSMPGQETLSVFLFVGRTLAEPEDGPDATKSRFAKLHVHVTADVDPGGCRCPDTTSLAAAAAVLPGKGLFEVGSPGLSSPKSTKSEIGQKIGKWGFWGERETLESVNVGIPPLWPQK